MGKLQEQQGSRRQKHVRDRKKDLERLARFKPMDDVFVRTMLRENVPLAQMILQIIMEKPGLVVTDLKTQADMNRVTGARSVFLDAYATDDGGRKYDVEIEKSESRADAHRARYHASVMDVENLDAGQDFKELPDVYVIFVTEKDLFGDGASVHSFQSRDDATGEPLGDGSHILYVNGEYRGDDDLGKLMHDFNCSDAGDMLFPLMAERARYLKENPEGVSQMCEIMDEIWSEGREEGLEQGEIMTLAGLVRDRVLTVEQAANRRSLTVDAFKKRCVEYNLTL